MSWIHTNSRGRWAMARAMLVILGLVGVVPWRVTAQQAPPATPPWPGFYYYDQPSARYGSDLVRLNRPYVLQELKATGQQRSRIDAVMAALRRQQVGSRPPYTEVSPAQREAEWEKVRQMVKQAHEQVAAILTPGQMQRLRQIHLQYNGAFALQEDDIATELGLTPEQRRQIRRIYQEHFRAVIVPASKLRDAEAERAEIRRFRQVYQRNQRRILAVLTGEQQDHFLQMLGRPLPNLEDTLLFRLRKR
jgi:hypothetical protein